MSLDSHRRATELFGRALDLDLPPAEQRAFLERECDGDGALAERVLALLERDRKSATSVDRSAIERLSPPAAAARVPERIGPYRILGLLGSGGMGLVYRAEQHSPRREVALKVIRGGLASLELVRRFEKEARVLGRLDHQGIARVYDAGVFDGAAGPEPFVAMELVQGMPLLDHVDRFRLSREKRVELLALVCDAVAHAHDQGIVHRDLKPSNVLVKPDGQPKVLDFGVALIVRGETLASTRQTSAGELVGTLPYMSPEQLEGDPRRVDERSDVYALGVMAYELLSGRRPHEVDGLSVPAAARLVLESTARRLGELDRTLRGDLETIVAKALAKDHELRYASVRELGEDLRRHLRHEPVRAVPPSRIDTLRRFARRNPALATSLLLAALLLVAGTVVSTWQARRANDAARASQRSAERAALAGARIAAEHHDSAASRRFLESVDPSRRDWVWRWVHEGNDDRIGTFVAAEPVRAAAFVPGTEEILALDAAGTIARWAPGGAGTRSSIELGTPLTGPAAFDAEGGFVAGVLGAEKETVAVWDAASGRRIGEISTGGAAPTAIAVSSGGRYVAFGGKGSFLWDTTGTQTVTFDAPIPASFAFSADGAQLGCAFNHPRNGPGWFLTVDTALGKVTVRNIGVVANDNFGVAIGPRGLGVIGSRSKRAYLLDLEKRRVLGEFAGDPAAVLSVAIDPSGARVATGSGYGTLRLWDTENRSEMAVLDGSNAGLRQVAFSGDGTRILGVAGNEVGLWEVSAEPDVLRGHASFVYDVAFLRGGRRLVSLTYNGHLRVIDADSLDLLRTTNQGPGTTGTSYALDVARDGDLVALARPKGVDILDGDSLEPIRTLPCPGGDTVREVDFSPDGRRLAALSEQRVVLFDVPSGEPLGSWSAVPNTPYGALVYSMDGRWFAHSAREAVIVRDGGSGAVLARLASRGQVEALAFSPGGDLLATGGVDRIVRIWDTRNWGEVAALEGHTDRVYALEFSPDGTILASGSNDTMIRLWSVEQRAELALLSGHEDYVFSLAFDPDGSRLVSASGDRTLRVWDTRSRGERWRAAQRSRASRDAVRPRMAALLSAAGGLGAAVRELRADTVRSTEEREACTQALLQLTPPSER